MEVQKILSFLKVFQMIMIKKIGYDFYLVPINLFFWKLCKRHIFWVFNLSFLIYNFLVVNNFRIIF